MHVSLRKFIDTNISYFKDKLLALPFLPYRVYEVLKRRNELVRNKALLFSNRNEKKINFSDHLIDSEIFELNTDLSVIRDLSAFVEEKFSNCKDLEFEISKMSNREFKILSSEYLYIGQNDLERYHKIKTIANCLPEEYVNKYLLIDWHTDFKSSYTWNHSIPYFEIKVAPVNGADIKIPRELSRFQHISLLASMPYETGGIEFLLQVLDWITANPVGYGVNWACTMDVSLRAVNWIWGIQFFRPIFNKYPLIAKHIYNSLYLHGKHIANNLEYYKINTGNHYLSNLAGLIYIGAVFPNFPESNYWLLFGIQELLSEMKREVYNDGYSHEGSTHYHRLVTELFLSCSIICERIPIKRRNILRKVNIQEYNSYPKLRRRVKDDIYLNSEGQLLPEWFYGKLYTMSILTSSLTKSNNLVPQFGDNDSARVHKLSPIPYGSFSDHRHIAASVNQLLNLSQIESDHNVLTEVQILTDGLYPISFKTDTKSTQQIGNAKHFIEAGIVVLKREDVFLAVTCGTNGQNKRGGHNHNDKLSFELNIKGVDFIVDGGCPVYTANPEMRNQFRSTIAHNTVMLVSQEQDKWIDGIGGLFGLREKSFPCIKLINEHIIEGEHYGFTVPHKRIYNLLNKKLVIQDEIYSIEPKKAFFNLHPSINCEIQSVNNSELTGTLVHCNGNRIHFIVKGVSNANIQEGFYSKGYGEREPNSRLVVEFSNTVLISELTW